MNTHEQLEFESVSVDEVSFQEIQSFQDSRYLYLKRIQHLPKRNQVIAGSGRHRDSGSLSECLNDIRLWDLKTGRVALKFGRIDEVLSALSVSPDEKYVLTAGYSEDVVTNRPMRLWDLNDGSMIRDFEFTTCSRCSTFSPCGKYALSGHTDGIVILWDVSTGKQIKTFSGHTENIIQIAFSPNGQLAYSACYREYVCIWDLSTGKLIERFGGSNSGASKASFSLDCRYVAFSGAVCFEEMDKIEEAAIIDDDFETPPEILRFEAAKREKSIRVWDIEKRQEHCRLRTKNEQGYAQQGSYITLNYNAQLGISFSNDYTRLWDISKGIEIGRLEKYTSHAHFSEDGKQVIAGSGSYGLSLYQLVGQTRH